MWKITKAGFVEIPVTDAMVEAAKERNEVYLARYGHAGTHRTKDPQQRMKGFVVEVGVESICPMLKRSDNDEVDWVCGGFTLDSKAVGCNSEPAPHYVGTYYKEQEKRNVDYLVFSRIKNDFTLIWCCGFISKSLFLEKATFCPSGTKCGVLTYEEPRYKIEYRLLGSPLRLIGDKQCRFT